MIHKQLNMHLVWFDWLNFIIIIQILRLTETNNLYVKQFLDLNTYCSINLQVFIRQTRPGFCLKKNNHKKNPDANLFS